MIATQPLPVFVLTGFLGSGKTTLLAGLLRHPDMANTAVVVNELGEIGLDHFLVSSSDEQIALLNAGCLCCAILNTLPETLADLFHRRVRGEVPPFERVIVETTGLADPGPIVRTLATSGLLAGHFRLAGVITAVDALLALQQLDRHPEVARQISVADAIVLTKTDIADRDATRVLTERIRRMNPASPIHEIANGRIDDPRQLIDAGAFIQPSEAGGARAWLREEAFVEAGAVAIGRDHASSDAPHAHHHDERIRAFSIHIDEPISWAGYACWIDLLKQIDGPRLLRMKGLLNIAESERPVVVQAVQHVFFRPVRLDRWPDADRRSRIVLITWDVDAALVERSLRALRAPAGSDARMSLAEMTEAS